MWDGVDVFVVVVIVADDVPCVDGWNKSFIVWKFSIPNYVRSWNVIFTRFPVLILGCVPVTLFTNSFLTCVTF
jgi:hypothetical protein